MGEPTSISPDKPEQSSEELYWADTYTWAMQQADALRRRDFSSVDWDNVIEEIEDMGKSELRRWKSHCASLIRHMLKLEYWPSWDVKTGQAWIRTISNAREQMRDTLDESPGLQSKKQEMLGQAWKTGRRNVARDLAELQTGSQIGRGHKHAWREWERKLPNHCPYELAAIEDPGWWPEGVQCRLERALLETDSFGMLFVKVLMKNLASDRPVFHSEADFQHSLGWRIQHMIPTGRVRPEHKPFPDESKRMQVDLWLPDIGVAMELKYSTREYEIEHEGEYFALKAGAPDNARYDFLKDIQRLEKLSDRQAIRVGLAILLTNDPACWSEPGPDAYSIQFSLHEDRRITGEMKWNSKASAKGIKDRKDPICLKYSYDLRWQKYADIGDGNGGQLRYLAVQIGH